MTQEILALATDDVVVVGYVEDLSHYLDRCRMSVVPLRYGAGMKGKIGTSMSYGVPCVATSVGTVKWTSQFIGMELGISSGPRMAE